MAIIYKIVTSTQWAEAQSAGRFDGAPVDQADGFIHFSSADQVRETAAKHFGGQSGLLLVGVEAEKLGDALKWEVSRGGALFPHLYASLDLAKVGWVNDLPLGPGGVHVFPEGL
ncbi:DUF952 domain-containing protein [Stappia sp. GBMRC 2046]|uniref:DUF952 domain-containing protein n=1 Tax=Stappia sediminis TaxID=2692190 RepID=A0A7X3S8M5_9HYPH|nr:DUF952 domain-containing protein [Stappia sediminis]MXN65954.1 DUF952 domain-containing protein [Stappia sediminis]